MAGAFLQEDVIRPSKDPKVGETPGALSLRFNGSDATLVQSRVCLTAPVFTSARACGHQALARTPSEGTTHHTDDLAGSLGLSCVRSARREVTEDGNTSGRGEA